MINTPIATIPNINGQGSSRSTQIRQTRNSTRYTASFRLSGASGCRYFTDSGSLPVNSAAPASNTRETAASGSIYPRKVPMDNANAVYRYRFWGLPMGVSMLPRFAAMVCSTTTGISSFCCPAMVSTITAKGTNVINATSLVMSMLPKKHSAVSKRHSSPVFRIFPRNRSPRYRNSPISCRPAITSIRQNSSASTR